MGGNSYGYDNGYSRMSSSDKMMNELQMMMDAGAFIVQAHPYREEHYIDHIRLFRTRHRRDEHITHLNGFLSVYRTVETVRKDFASFSRYSLWGLLVKGNGYTVPEHPIGHSLTPCMVCVLKPSLLSSLFISDIAMPPPGIAYEPDHE